MINNKARVDQFVVKYSKSPKLFLSKNHPPLCRISDVEHKNNLSHKCLSKSK